MHKGILSFKIVLLSCVFISAFPKYSLPQNNNSILWEITGNGLKHPSYLFGTIHAICEEDFFLPDSFETCFNRTEEVALELDMDKSLNGLKLLAKLKMKNGKDLSDILDKNEYELVKTFFEDSLDRNLKSVSNFKPLFLTAFISDKLFDCRVEMYEVKITSMAKKAGKDIVGIETLEDQIKIFDKIPYREQANILLNTVKEFSDSKKEFDSLIYYYKEQNLNELYELIKRTEFDLNKFEDILLLERNKNWIPEIEKIIKSKSAFIAVGAGHLVGENGLINLLKKRNYLVKPK